MRHVSASFSGKHKHLVYPTILFLPYMGLQYVPDSWYYGSIDNIINSYIKTITNLTAEQRARLQYIIYKAHQ